MPRRLIPPPLFPSPNWAGYCVFTRELIGTIPLSDHDRAWPDEIQTMHHEGDDGGEVQHVELPDLGRRIYRRAGWEIHVLMRDPSAPAWFAFCRSAFRDGRECILFTLIHRQIDYAAIQAAIWSNGEVEHDSHIPIVVRIHPRKKRLTIQPLAELYVDPARGICEIVRVNQMEVYTHDPSEWLNRGDEVVRFRQQETV